MYGVIRCVLLLLVFIFKLYLCIYCRVTNRSKLNVITTSWIYMWYLSNKDIDIDIDIDMDKT